MGVKWFTKSIFFSLGLVLLLIMFFSVNSSTFSLSQDKAGAYAGCGDSIINFIGKNNDIIYSVGLPADKSLNDLEKSNLLKNSDFSDNYRGLSEYNEENSPSGAYVSRYWIHYVNNDYKLTYLDDGINIETNSSGVVDFAQVIENGDMIVGSKNISFSLVVDNIFYSKSDVVLTKGKIFGLKLNSKVYIYVEWTSGNIFKYWFRVFDNVSVNIKCAKLEIGETATPYYTADYVQRLYGEKLNNYIWSMSPVNYTPYDFDKHTPSTSLHYVKNKPIFSLVDTWNKYVLMLNNQSSTTINALNRVKEKWSHILEISDNMSNIFSSSSSSSPLDAPAGILNLGGFWKDKVTRFIGNIISMIYNLLVLVFYFFILIISPIIDMFSYLIAIIIGGDINSWSFLN